jgi:single-strand DNA-binding protein
MPYINRCQFMGHAGKDWEFEKLTSGTSVLRGSLAISKGKDKAGQDRGTVWIQCKVWGKYAEVINGWGGVGKGDLVMVSGRWDQNKGKEGRVFESLNVDELTNFTTLFKGGNGNGSASGAAAKGSQGISEEDFQGDFPEEEEADIPF